MLHFRTIYANAYLLDNVRRAYARTAAGVPYAVFCSPLQ